MKARSYQSEDVEKIFEEWQSVRSTLYVAATGLGKTFVMSEVVRRSLPKRALLLCHRRELIFQAYEAFTKRGIECEIEKAELSASTSLFNRTPVVLATVQTLISGEPDRKRMHRFNPEHFDILLYDECVPAGTLIDGRPIEQIRVGDAVKTQLGYGKVYRTSHRPITEIVEIEFDEGGNLACSRNHPIWTPNGFVPAHLLTCGSVVATITEYEERNQNLKMRGMRNRSYLEVLPPTEAVLKLQLQVGVLPSNHPLQFQQTWWGDNQIPEDQRHESSRSPGEGLYKSSGHGLETAGAWREWSSAYNPRTGAFMCTGVALQRSCQQQAANLWFSELLQVGYWEYCFEDWGGSGWIFSQGNAETRARPEKGGFFGFKRVASVTVHQQGSGEGFTRLCPGGLVYNLEVSNGNTYFANGVLVHNSHHSVSPGNKKIVDYFTSGNENLRVLGVTATPTRADETALGQIFETVVEPPRDILFGINEGWLVNIDQRFVSVSGLDFSHMRTTAGDLNTGDLSAVMEAESCIQGVVHPTLEILFNLPEGKLGTIGVPEWGNFLEPISKRRRAIVFTVSVAQAEMLSGIFNRVVPGIADWVCGKTPDKDRDERLNKFKTGETSILVNCGVTTEGYDNPEVDMIVMARPTKSQTLYTQMVGRGTRVLPGLVDDLPDKQSRLEAIAASRKPILTVVDLVGNSGKHKLICTADILGGSNTEEVVERVIKQAKEQKGQFRVTEALAEEEEKFRQELERRRLLEEARKRSVVARVIYKTTSIDPFNALDITPARSRGWNDGKSLSPKQRALLVKQGINPDQLTYAGGRQIIAEMFRRWNGQLATFKQAAIIKRHYGSEHDTKTMTRKQATEIIDALAANRWRKPQPTNV